MQLFQEPCLHGRLAFELFPERTLTLYCFDHVVNNAEIRNLLLEKKFGDYALIDGKMVVDVFQIQVAAARTLLNDSTGKLITNTLHSELVFNLSGSRNVRDSFRHFGISDVTSRVIVGVFDVVNHEEVGESIQALVQGQLVSLDVLEKGLSEEELKRVKKCYKINQDELNSSSLIDAIVTRISTKSCLQ